jgi:putative PIN family toxin of toxin-antitoxin system
LLLCGDIVSELRDVMLRPVVQERFPILTGDFIDVFLDRIEHIGTRMEPVPALFQFPRDPDDEPYMNLAVDGAAQYLVTRDRDLLDLAEPTTDEARQICPGLRILDPVKLLRELVAKPE